MGLPPLIMAFLKATTPWQLLVPRPSGTSASAAAALPTVYTTVDVAFAELAKLKKGEKAWPEISTGELLDL